LFWVGRYKIAKKKQQALEKRCGRRDGVYNMWKYIPFWWKNSGEVIGVKFGILLIISEL
jgi:hypothetical protein